MKPYVYLCGPIHGLTEEEAGDWRNVAEAYLHPEFRVLSPLRGKSWEGTDYGRYTDEELVQRDLADIRKSRAVLRFCPGPSHGSDMETFYASHVCGIPVVVFGPGMGDRKGMSLWLRKHTVQGFETLKEAAQYLKDQWLLPHEQKEEVAVSAA